MPMKDTEKHLTLDKLIWLMLTVHVAAFIASPRAYLVASWWRICGKRVRSRAQMAPLLSTSKRAYELWLMNEPTLPVPRSDQHADPTIVALVDARQSDIGLDDTLHYLAAERVTAVIIGSAATPTFRSAIGAVDWANNPWIMPIQSGDRLRPGAAAAYRNAIMDSEARVFYADDDLLGKEEQRMSPHFKPDWNAELFLHFDYVSGAAIFNPSRANLEKVEADSNWANMLVAQLSSPETPRHIPAILHSRRRRPRPNVPARTLLPTQNLPSVSIIIPTRNRVDLLRTCLQGIAATRYPDVEILIVDNGSDDPATVDFLRQLDPTIYKLLSYPGPFNYSAINNYAARHARGTLLCLLNNDVEIIESDWLTIMATQALRDEVGTVGARLLYPDGRIQHAGVVIGMGNAAGHAHRFIEPGDEGYFHRHALPQFVSAVTGACLVVSKQRFEAVGGLDEDKFPVAFNDVDLCMRLNARGWQSLYEPRATLIHHESVSRGLDRDPIGAARFATELKTLKETWATDVAVDPFHHPGLSRATEQFVVRL